MRNVESGPVLCRLTDGVATLTFNRPEVLNAIDQASALAFRDIVTGLAGAEGLRVIVLTGAGGAFVAGGDISAFGSGDGDPAPTFRALIDPVHDALDILTSLPVPVVASVDGAAAGGGFSVAMAADLVIASDRARFGMAYAKLGISPDGSGTWSLPRLVGLRRALELAFLSDMLSADEALAEGLINRVVPADDLAAETDALAQRLAQGPTHAFGAMKALLRESLDRDIRAQMDAERDALIDTVRTEDFREGLAAFRQRRRPVFRGK